MPSRVVICGAGPAGLATSIHLARAGLDVELVERGDFTGIRVGEHVSSRGAQLLVGLGLDLARAACAAPCTEIRSVWGSPTVHTVDSIFDPSGPGYLVSRPDFDRALVDLAVAAGVGLRSGRSVVDVTARDSVWQVRLRSGSGAGEVVEAGFVVDATGRAAVIAKKFGVQSSTVDRLVGICGFVDATLDAPYSILIEATRDGWWYSSSPPGGRGVLTFMTDADELGGERRPADLWSRYLDSSVHTRARLADGRADPNEIVVRSAHSHCLDRCAGDGWLAVGDSALSYDPLSSAGIEKGLEHGLLAARAVVAWFDGDASLLAIYGETIRSASELYLQNRIRTYDSERRWPTAPFWTRRQSPSTRRG